MLLSSSCEFRGVGTGEPPQYLERGSGNIVLPPPQYLALILQDGVKIAWFKPMFC